MTAPTPPPPPVAGRRPVFLSAALALLLAASASMNVVLYRLALRLYRDQLAVRLDPADTSRYPPAVAARPRRPRVVFFGDSRVEMWASPPSPEGFEVVNRGVSHETTAQALLRLDRDVIRQDPRVVVVQLGVNDLRSLALFPGREAAIVAGCESNLREAVDRLRDRGIFVVLTTIFPVGRVELARRPVWSDASIDAIDAVNRRLLALNGPGLAVVDSDKILRNGRLIEPAFSVDSLHLSPAGYEALSAALTPTLERAATEPGAH